MLSSITGLDVVALLLFLHGWLILVAVVGYSGNDAFERLDRRFGVGIRPLAVWWLLGTVVLWLPLAVGNVPTDELAMELLLLAGFGLFVGLYFLAGAVTNGRAYLTVRRTETTDAADVAAGGGLVEVSGTVRPLEEPARTPIEESPAVCYRFAVAGEPDDATAEWARSQGGGGAPIASLVASFAPDPTLHVEDERRRFALEDGTGRVIVDPTDADLRLERTASVTVPGDEHPPRSVLARVGATDDLDPSDRDRTYYEATLEPGETAYVLGTARREEDGDPVLEGSEDREYVVAPGCEREVERHFLGTVALCLALGGTLTVGSAYLVAALAGVG